MTPTEHPAKTPSTRTDSVASRVSSRRAKGTGAPSLRCLALLALATAALLAFAAAPALAAPPSEFGEEGSGAGRFNNPFGIAVDNSAGSSGGDVYLVDTNNLRVDKFSSEGEFQLAFGWGVADGAEALQTCGPESSPLSTTCQSGHVGPGVGQFGGEPRGLAVDSSAGASQGDVYVLDHANNRVEKFNPTGQFILMIGGEVDQGPSHPGNLCTAAFIAEGDSCGAGVEGSGPGQFAGLREGALAVGSGGSLFVGDNERVQKFSEAGALEGETALPGIGFVYRLAADSAGDLYVTSEGMSGVHKYDQTGAELGEPRDPSASFYSSPIALGPADRLFVYNREAGHVDLFAPAGAQLSSFPVAGQERGIAYGDAINRLYQLQAATVRLLTPPPPGPLVISEEATEIATTSATLNATLNPEGGEETTYEFEYGTEAGVYTKSTPPTELTAGSFEDQPAEAAIENLQPRTTYHFRLVVTNKAGETTEGPDQQFTTLPPVSIDSTSAFAISATAATLQAELNPHGLPTTYHFEYDTTAYAEGGAPHGTSTPTGQAGSGTAEVTRSAQLQGLAPATTYHFRLVAENSLGTTEGPDRSFTTQGPDGPPLPDGRGWEMVSPAEKGGIPLEGLAFDGADIQAAADGSGLAYVALGAINDEASGNLSPNYSELLARRGASAWSTATITTANEVPQGLIVGQRSEYRLFSSDLSLAAVEPLGATPLSPQATERTPYLRRPDGSFTPLLTSENVPPGTHFGGVVEQGGTTGGVVFVAATPDLAHLVLTSPQDLTEPLFAAGGLPSLYEWSAGSLSLISQVPAGSATLCGPTGPENCIPAAAAGLSSELGPLNQVVRHAISADGSRAVFRASSDTADHLWLRDLTREETIQLDVLQPGAEGGNGHPRFEDASAEDSRVFFTDESRLTADATATEGKPDLYMCQIEVSEAGQLACQLTDLTAHPGEAANVQGVLGASEDGPRVFFVANGALTAGAVHGNCEPNVTPAANSCNLYAYDSATHATQLVAVLSNRDFPDWHATTPELGRITSRVSPDGRWLAFMSERSLTGYDNRDAASGEPDEEVFLYHAPAGAGEEGKLICASCNPTGARPRGLLVTGQQERLVDRPASWVGNRLAASIPGWTKMSEGRALYQSRYLSDSGRLFFNAADALVPRDSNGTEDVYQYEPAGSEEGAPPSDTCTTTSPTYSAKSEGCVDLISSGASGEESAFLDASESGDDVFFLTAAKLRPEDVDSALDVYDAHVCTAELPCPPPPPPAAPECSGDACQAPAVPPNHPTPGTSLLNGPGNLVECPKGKVKRSGRCVARKHKKSHKKHAKKKHAKKRTANNSRRASR